MGPGAGLLSLQERLLSHTSSSLSYSNMAGLVQWLGSFYLREMPVAGWLLSLSADASFYDPCWYLCYIGYPGSFFVSFRDSTGRSSRASQRVGGHCDLRGMSNNAEIIRSREEVESKLNDSVF